MSQTARVFFLIVGIAGMAFPAPVLAQQPQHKQAKPASKAVAAPAASSNTAQAAPADASAPPQPVWTSRCSSEGRKAALLCEIEQSLFISKTGQLVASVNVKLPPETRQPVMMIQLPVGLFLPGGVNLQIDESKPQALVIQTCDLKGCYAATTISPELLGAMKTGKRLSVTFQNLNKENVNLAFVLSGFAESYDRIN